MEDRQKGENHVRETKLRAKSEARIARAKGDKDIATAQVVNCEGIGELLCESNDSIYCGSMQLA